MRVNIIAVGKIKENYFTDAIKEYSKRLQRFCDFKIIEVNEASVIENIEKKKEIEGEALLSNAKGFIVSLERQGKQMSSEKFAQVIDEKMSSGYNEISFIIGGSNGISEKVKKSSNLLLSFGEFTYPHQMFRVVLCEQIYRAFTILSNLPYHK